MSLHFTSPTVQFSNANYKIPFVLLQKNKDQDRKFIAFSFSQWTAQTSKLELVQYLFASGAIIQQVPCGWMGNTALEIIQPHMHPRVCDIFHLLLALSLFIMSSENANILWVLYLLNNLQFQRNLILTLVILIFILSNHVCQRTHYLAG